ncbi:hypothetical protein [Trichococcus shcherbakoviae]|uniref:hypothetical protein n=1 Tax=Trichococcus shcherbakoviae TaxID=2094020 RepID=UPI002AA653C1|nr:hypothetical protein [Trichococcus shcherbakoviae]
MSAEIQEGLETSELQAVRDLKRGFRVRKAWSKILVKATENNLNETQVRGFINGGGLFAADADRKLLATSLGFDWEGAATFFATIAPIIVEMMAACGV